MVNLDICTNGFLNCNDTIGILIGSATQYNTGDLFLTFFWVLFVLLAICIMFGIRLEYTLIILLPLFLTYMAFYKEFIAIGIIVFIYLGIVVGYNFMSK